MLWSSFIKLFTFLINTADKEIYNIINSFTLVLPGSLFVMQTEALSACLDVVEFVQLTSAVSLARSQHIRFSFSFLIPRVRLGGILTMIIKTIIRNNKKITILF